MDVEPVITIVDARGHTVRRFRKRVSSAADEMWVGDIHIPAKPAGTVGEWLAVPAPQSKKSQRQADATLRREDVDLTARYSSPNGMHSVDGDRLVIELPGLTLRWERLTPVLDKLAEAGITTLTVDELRSCIR